MARPQLVPNNLWPVTLQASLIASAGCPPFAGLIAISVCWATHCGWRKKAYWQPIVANLGGCCTRKKLMQCHLSITMATIVWSSTSIGGSALTCAQHLVACYFTRLVAIATQIELLHKLDGNPLARFGCCYMIAPLCKCYRY